jgi:hypothetical protein
MSATCFGSGHQWLAAARASRALVAVEPASTFATLDNFQQAPICSWPLISKAIRVSPPFGISAANVEVSARDVFVPFAWIGSSIELSKDAQSKCDKSEGARGKSRFPDGNDTRKVSI